MNSDCRGNDLNHGNTPFMAKFLFSLNAKAGSGVMPNFTPSKRQRGVYRSTCLGMMRLFFSLLAATACRPVLVSTQAPVHWVPVWA